MNEAVARIHRHALHHGRTVLRHAKNHLIPHEGNNHHPTVLHHRALVAYSVFLILLKAAAVVTTVALPSSSLYSSSITAPNIVDLTNAARTSLALPILSLNSQLSHAAQMKAEDMLKKQYFAHTSPSGANALTWIGLSGYSPIYAAENLAVHYLTSEDVQKGWLASPTHRANIVNPRYTEIGVGIAHGQFESSDSIIVVQMFGRPAATAVAQASTTTQMQAATGTSGVEEASVKIAKKVAGYQVTLSAPAAKAVHVSVGNVSTPLLSTSSTSGTWSGTVPVDPLTLSTNGDQMSAIVVGQAGSTEHVPLALVAPLAKTNQVYQFADSGEKTLTLFNKFHLENLDDSVRRTYAYFIVFLVAALLLTVFIKIRIQHASVIVHTLGVIGLAMLLWLV